MAYTYADTLKEYTVNRLADAISVDAYDIVENKHQL